jgi:hypothetical protein
MLSSSDFDPTRTLGRGVMGQSVCPFSLAALPQSARLSTSMKRFLRGLNETARVHCAYQRSGGLAGGGSRAAG